MIEQDIIFVGSGLPQIDGTYFQLGCDVLQKCINDDVSPDNTFDILLRLVYSSELRSVDCLRRLRTCWRDADTIVNETLTANSFPTDSWTRDVFDHCLRIFKDALFDPIHICKDISRINIDSLVKSVGESITSLIFPKLKQTDIHKPLSVSKKIVRLYLQSLPSSINLRLIYESARSVMTPDENFLIEEGNNLLGALRIVRKELIEALQSYSVGVYSLSTISLFRYIEMNVIPDSWIKYFHPTQASLESWISGLAEKISALEKRISGASQTQLLAQDYFSIRSLIRTLQWRYCLSQSIPFDQSSLSLQFRGDHLSIPQNISHILIKGINVRSSDRIVPISLIIKPRSQHQKELIEHDEQIVEIIRFTNENYDMESENSLTIQISPNHGSYHYLEDSTRLNDVIKFDIDPQYLKKMKLNLPLCALIEIEKETDCAEMKETLKRDSEEYVLQNIEASHHVSIYLSSSIDAENERAYITNVIYPELKKLMFDKHIDLQLVDMRIDSQHSENDLDSIALASCTQISRCHIFIGVYGAKLGGNVSSYIRGSVNAIFNQIVAENITMPEVEIQFALKDQSLAFIGDQRSSFFYLRDPNFARSVPKTFKERYESADQEEIERVRSMKEKLLLNQNCTTYTSHFTRVIGNRLQMGGLEKFGDILKYQLERTIKDVVAQRTAKSLRIETSYCSPPEIIDKIVNAADLLDHHNFPTYKTYSTPSTLFVVQGDKGIGKTALMSHICNRFLEMGCIVLYSFVRSWVGSFSINSMIRRFCLKLMYFLKLPMDDLSSETSKLKEHWIYLIRKAIALGNTVTILIDGVDRMENEHGENASLCVDWMPNPSELGTEAFSNTLWILSTGNEQSFGAFRRANQNAERIIIPVLAESQKREYIKGECNRLGLKIEQKPVDQLIKMKSSDSPLFIHLILKEAQEKKNRGHFGSLDLNNEKSSDIFAKILNRLEKSCGLDLIRMLFSYLSFSRNGLREVEIMGLLKLEPIGWNLLFRSVDSYIKKTATGFIILYVDQFSAEARSRYASKELETSFYHRELACYYIRIFHEEKHSAAEIINPIRIIDIPYHLFHANAMINEISNALCSIDYITSAFKCNVYHELDYYFRKAIIMASKEREHRIRTNLTEYNFFVERNHSYLQSNPRLAFTLALDLPNGLCSNVKAEAQLIFSKAHEIYARRISISEDQLEMAPLGSHVCNIIYVGVRNLTSLGKYCITISSDGTTVLWNIDTYLRDKTLLSSPLGSDTVNCCALGLNDAELIAFGTKSGHLIIYNLANGEKKFHLDYMYSGGQIFFSESNEGVWRIWKKRLAFSAFPHLNQRSSSAIQRDPIKSNHIVAQSNDGLRIAYLNTGLSRGFTVLSTKTMRDVCHFKESNLSELSIGTFSPGKDVIAITMTTGDIMVQSILYRFGKLRPLPASSR